MTRWVCCVLWLACGAAAVGAQDSALERFERLRGAGQGEAAAAELAGWVEANPKDTPAAMALGRHYSETGRVGRALKVWRRAFEQGGDEAAFAGVANQLVGSGETAAAIEMLELGRRRLNDGRLFSLQIAELHLRRQALPPAVREYLAYLDLQPHRLGQVVHRLRSTAGEGAQVDGLLNALQAAYRQRGDRNSAVLYAYVSVAAGRPERGLDALRAGLKQPEIAEALFQFAARCEAEKHTRVAATAYGLFVDAVPQSPYRHQALLRQGELEARLGGASAASAVYRRLAAEAPQRPEAVEALLELAGLTLAQRGDLAAVRQALEQVLKARPRGISADRARLLLCETALRQGDLDEAAGHLEYVASQAHAAEALFRQAEVDFFAGAYDDARQGLEAFAEQEARDARGNDALDLLLLLEEHADAEEALQAYADARLATRRGAADAGAAWQRLKAVAPAKLSQRAAWERARLAEEAGAPNALELYGDLGGDYAVEGHMGQARLFEERGDLDKALKAYETALLNFADDPRGPLVRLHILRLRPLVPDSEEASP